MTHEISQSRLIATDKLSFLRLESDVTNKECHGWLAG